MPAGVPVDSLIQAWIGPVLNTLHLSADFRDRVVKSAQVSAMRYLHRDAELPPGHIHLSIHAPREQPVLGKTWGFFHIERVAKRGEARDGQDHAIDFYLYVEGG